MYVLFYRARSGNPGYLLGLPVLFGQLSSPVINQLVDGFTVPSAIAPFDFDNPDTFGLSICPQGSSYTSTSSTGSTAQVQVKFGYDLTSGCSVHLNRSELINLCCAGSGSCSGVVGQSYFSKYSDVSTGIPYFYKLATGYVVVVFLTCISSTLDKEGTQISVILYFSVICWFVCLDPVTCSSFFVTICHASDLFVDCAVTWATTATRIRLTSPSGAR